MCTPSRRLLRKTFKLASSAGAVAAVLTLAGTALTQEAPKKEEVFNLTTAIHVPPTGLGASTFFSFDISWFDPVLERYFLADRNNKTIDVINPANNSLTQFINAGFAGFTGDNDTSGPDGVLTANNSTELWVGDGLGKVWVLKSSDGTVKTLPGTPPAPNPILVKTTGNPPVNASTTRADELCYDPQDKRIMIASPAEDPPFVTFISTETYLVVGHITFGPTDTINATGGLEQCGWSPKTGKFYQNVPVVGSGPAGAVAVINPKTMKIETSFPVSAEACELPQGMAIGPSNQMLLGCGGKALDGHRNSVVINANSGALLAVLPDLGGADEVWFNQGDGHYFIPACNEACRHNPGSQLEELGIIDSRGFKVDQRVPVPSPAGATGRRIHSVAADPVSNQIYVPIPAIAVTFQPSICSSAPIKIGVTPPTDATGCIAVFAVTKGEDDRPRAILERPQNDRQE